MQAYQSFKPALIERQHALFRLAARKINQWVADNATWDALPADFCAWGDSWISAEAEITRAVNDGDAVRFEALGRAYLARIDNFLAAWDTRLMKQKEAA